MFSFRQRLVRGNKFHLLLYISDSFRSTSYNEMYIELLRTKDTFHINAPCAILKKMKYVSSK